MKELRLDEIYVDENFNCRGAVRAVDVVELAEDIYQRGLLSPIIVRPNNRGDTKYDLVAGFRRYKAHKILQKEHNVQTIEASIKNLSDIDAAAINLTENTHRSGLTLLQEARGLGNMHRLGVPVSEIARRVGKSHPWVDLRLGLLTLPKQIQEDADLGLLKGGDIKNLVTASMYISEEDLFKMTRKMKVQNVTPRKNKKEIKAPAPTKNSRTRREIFAMLDHIQCYFESGVLTRLLAWAAHEIDDSVLIEELEKFSKEYPEFLLHNVYYPETYNARS